MIGFLQNLFAMNSTKIAGNKFKRVYYNRKIVNVNTKMANSESKVAKKNRKPYEDVFFHPMQDWKTQSSEDTDPEYSDAIWMTGNSFLISSLLIPY